MLAVSLFPLSWIDVIVILACWFAGVCVVMVARWTRRRRSGPR